MKTVVKTTKYMWKIIAIYQSLLLSMTNVLLKPIESENGSQSNAGRECDSTWRLVNFLKEDRN
jgi:hypothetical protein